MAPRRCHKGKRERSIHNNNHHVFMSVLILSYFISSVPSPSSTHTRHTWRGEFVLFGRGENKKKKKMKQKIPILYWSLKISLHFQHLYLLVCFSVEKNKNMLIFHSLLSSLCYSSSKVLFLCSFFFLHVLLSMCDVNMWW